MTTRVLLVDESGADASKVIAMLAVSGRGEFHVTHAPTVGTALTLLGGGSFDAILVDFGKAVDVSPGRLAALLVAATELPVVVLTENDDEDVGAAALQAGAQDYLVKSRINGDVLRRVIRYSRERTCVQRAFETALADHQKRLEELVVERTGKLSREIADRVRIEAALRESQHRMQAITDNLFEGVLVLDQAGHVILSNQSADLLLGERSDVPLAGKEPKEPLAGKEIDAIFTLVVDKRRLPYQDGPFRQVAQTGELHQEDDAVFQTAGGRSLMVAFACSPLIDGGQRMGSIISFRDIRALKKAQQEALQASKLASVGQLAAGIAHEINTPTQYIGDNLRFIGDAFGVVSEVLESSMALVAAELPDSAAAVKLRDEAEAADLDYLLAEFPQAISQSLEGVGQVSRIVLAMKEFSHPGEREKVAVNLNRAIENTLAVSRNEWKHVAEIDLDLDAALPQIVCLPGEINQVMLNLVVNAAHAIQLAKPTAKGRIAIATRRRGAAVDIVIGDDGTGMPDEVKDRIFDPFFTTKAVGMGTGQGLAICRDVVVAKHGGRIAVDTEEGKGTTFTISLPIDGNSASLDGSQ